MSAASFFRAAPKASMNRTRQWRPGGSTMPGSPCLAFATACNCWPTNSAAKSRRAPPENSVSPCCAGPTPTAGLLEGLDASVPVWMSHGDRIDELPPGFRVWASSENSPIAVMGNDLGMYGIQFHPEVAHTPQGAEIIRNFAFKVCGCEGTWTPSNFVSDAIEHIRAQVGDGRVICALSGGVDSAVAAALINRAIGDRLTCIFVNNGLMRRAEPERVQDLFSRNLGLKLVYANEAERFLSALKGVTDPEVKRKRIGEEFIRVFEEKANELGEVDFLAQGTLYPDVIESKTPESTAAHKIKTHHNVGGLPERMKLQLVEPLRYMFKDEVRLGRG